MILNTHDPCESDFSVTTAPVLWLMRAHSAPGTAAVELSTTAARSELETFCANATPTAQAKITSKIMVNFFIETPIAPANPQAGCPKSRRGLRPVTLPVKQLKRSIYPKKQMQDKSTPISYCLTRGSLMD